jgi:hypothetical protein
MPAGVVAGASAQNLFGEVLVLAVLFMKCWKQPQALLFIRCS